MNLQESDLFKEELKKDSKNKRRILFSIIICAILIAILLVLILIIKHKDSTTLKMYLDNNQIAIPSGLYKEIDQKVYFDIKQLGNMLGYNYTRGVYGEYNENQDSCYMQNDFEIVAISSGEKKYTKYLQLSGQTTLGELNVTAENENGYNELFQTADEIKFQDGIIFVSINDVNKMFNIQLDWQQYRINIYTLNYFVNFAKNIAAKYGVHEISGNYENFRALLDGYIVVGDGKEGVQTKQYGVILLQNGTEIISKKYSKVLYAQNTKEFYITTANGMMGILNYEGGTVISPSDYSEISLLDQENLLYLVKKEDKYGVLDKNGKAIIYAENDKIGIDTESFKLEKISNNCLLLGKCIPVMKDKNQKKYSLYNLNGKEILQSKYDLGCKIDSKIDTTGDKHSVLIIPSSVGINGIVINYDNLYGIFDIDKETTVFPCVANSIYAVVEEGETTYYAEYGGEQIKIEDWLKENQVNSDEEDPSTNLPDEDNPIIEESENINEN